MNEYALLAGSALRTAVVNRRGRSSPWFESPRGILVVKLDHLGDLLLATPALRALRESRPGVPVDAIVLPGSAPLLEGSSLVDRVVTYDSPLFRRSGAPAGAANAGTATAALGALSGRRYDWIVELRGDEWTSGPLLRALRPVRRFDRGTVRLRDWLSRRWARLGGRPHGPPLHEVETNLLILAGAIDARGETPPVEAPPWPEASNELERVARERAPNFDLGRPYAVIQLGASWGPRAWDAERFGAVAAELRAAYDASIAVLGVAGDSRLRAAYLAGGGPADSAFFFGSLSLPAVGALLRGAGLFMGSDGGLAHLAAACGAPSVVLFGPQNPARFRPRGPRIVVLHRPVECYPCAQVVCVRPERPCVNLNTVEEAVEAAKRLWNSAPA